MRLILLLILLCGSVQAQSLWFEAGLGYLGQDEGFDSGFKVTTRVVVPVAERTGLFGALGLGNDFSLSAGVWTAFPIGIEDVEGLRSYGGAGLGFVDGRFGLALSLALSYELSRELELGVVYSHHPLFLPELSQAFNLSLALIVDVGGP